MSLRRVRSPRGLAGETVATRRTTPWKGDGFVCQPLCGRRFRLPGPARWARSGAGERPPDSGQLIPLSIGYAAVALLLVLVVVAATVVQLDRKRLQALADAAALDAADALAREEYYLELREGGTLEVVPVSEETVSEAVHDHLARQPGAGRLPGLRVDTATARDGPRGTAAVVVLQASSAPFLPPVVTTRWSAGVPLEARAEAVSVINNLD